MTPENPTTPFQRVSSAFTAFLHGQNRLPQTQTLIFFAVIVGISAAGAAVGFISMIRVVTGFFVNLSESSLYGVAVEKRYWTPIVPALGGFLVALVLKIAHEATGHGVPEVMNAVARKGGIIRPRVAVVKGLASAICIGSGGSAGREGPIVQIGSAIGSTVGQIFKMSSDRMRVLVGCGAAAGISAIFNAPISGAIFTLEIIMGDFGVKTFAPILISSVVASVVSRSALGNFPAFSTPAYELVSIWEMPLYALMGGLIGALSVGFIHSLSWAERVGQQIKINPLFKPALGGLCVGIIGIFFPQVFADGYETITHALEGKIVWGLLAALVVLKIIATCFTLGSGSSGGLFAPSLFIGAMAGGAFGYLVAPFFPGHTGAPGAFALVGMAAAIGGTTHAPLTGILMIFELTNDYRIILPVMTAVIFATLVAQKLEKESIYTIKLANMGIHLRGGKDIDILRSVKVRDIMDTNFVQVSASATTTELMKTSAHTDESYFMVVDPHDRLTGVLSFGDLRRALVEGSPSDLIIAQDIASTPLVLSPDDTLEQAQALMGRQGIQLAPVVDLQDPGRVIGVVREDKILRVYNRKLMERL